MGFPPRLNGKATNLNGGEHIMKLRVLLTLIEDNLSKISETTYHAAIAFKVENIRTSLPDFLFLNDSKALKALNEKLEMKWRVVVNSQNKNSYIDVLQTLDEIDKFLSEYYVAICPSCGMEFPVEVGFFAKLFHKTGIKCPSCNTLLPPKKG